MAPNIFTLSSYVGLWLLDRKGSPLNSKIYTTMAIIISVLGITFEIVRFPIVFRTEFFSEHYYVHFIDNTLSKLALISHCFSCVKNKKCFQKVYKVIGRPVKPRIPVAAIIGFSFHAMRFACPIVDTMNLQFHHQLSIIVYLIMDIGKLLITLQLRAFLSNSSDILKKSTSEPGNP